jgi:hypothetical protein
MKTLDYVLENYGEFEVALIDRFATRFINFLSVKQIDEKWGLKEGTDLSNHTPLDWAEENILKILKLDLKFGLEKAYNQRGISASLMHDVCVSWCKVLENDLVFNDDYNDYGLKNLKEIVAHYRWEDLLNYEEEQEEE